MRILFSVLGLLVVVAIVGVLAKKQLGAVSAPAPAVTGLPAAAPGQTPAQQSQQLQRQVQQNVEGLMQQARPMPEDPK